MSFLLKTPRYDCLVHGTYTEDCSTDMICQGSEEPQIQYFVDYEDEATIHNWYKQMDLVCAP